MGPEASTLIMSLSLHYPTEQLYRTTFALVGPLLELSNFITYYTKILWFLQCNMPF